MADMMTFPDTVEEFMEEYKLVDTEQVYTNGTELVPIFRMKQWFEHEKEQLSQEGATSDLISRQAAIDGLDGHYIERRNLNDWQAGWNAALDWMGSTYLDEFPSAQFDKDIDVPSNDTISRKAAIDAVNNAFDRETLLTGFVRSIAVRAIRDMPPAQSERKKGKWIYNSPVTMKCDQCGLVIKDWDWHRFKICPNCGADMRGEKDG